MRLRSNKSIKRISHNWVTQLQEMPAKSTHQTMDLWITFKILAITKFKPTMESILNKARSTKWKSIIRIQTCLLKWWAIALATSQAPLEWSKKDRPKLIRVQMSIYLNLLSYRMELHKKAACLVRSPWCSLILSKRATVRLARVEAKIVDSPTEVARQGLVEEEKDQEIELPTLVVDRKIRMVSSRPAHLSRTSTNPLTKKAWWEVPKLPEEFSQLMESINLRRKIQIRLSNLTRPVAHKTKWTCKCRCKVPTEAKIAASVEWSTQTSRRISVNLRDQALKSKTEVVESTEILTSHRRRKEITQCKYIQFSLSNQFWYSFDNNSQTRKRIVKSGAQSSSQGNQATISQQR